MAGDRFTTNEKLFVSLVGPRGIIPASVATLFAVELQSEQPEAATALVGTVFLVILVTVAVEGGLARTIAEHLDVIPMRVIVVGAGRVGMALASRLEDRGENVVLVEMDEEQVEIARNAGHIVHIGDGADIEVLRNAGMGNARIAVAATGDDDVNLLIAQLADSNFDVETVLARVNNPGNVEAFRNLGVQVISSTDATAQALDNLIERPALADWTSNIGDVGDVQEVEVTANELVGRTVRDVGPDLPSSVLIALVARDGEVEVPDAGYELRRGDRITLIGSRDAVRDAMEFCHPG
jgi:Trk K+ transport system NAD-binding subunit